MSRRNTIQDVLLKLVICEPSTLPTGCWEWPRSKNAAGYGHIGFEGRLRLVHRLVYEHFVGPIPEGLEPHHECENPACSNFEHLTLLTRKQHRQIHPQKFFPNKLKTHCPKGHEYTPENTCTSKEGERSCRECRYQAMREYRKKKKDGRPIK